MDGYESLGLGGILSQNANFQNNGNYRGTSPKSTPAPKVSVGSVLGGVAHGFGSLASAAGHSLLDPIEHLGEQTANLITGNQNLGNINKSRASLDQQAQTIQQHYAKMPKTPKNIASFHSSMKLIQQGYSDLSKQSSDQTKQYADPYEYLKNLAATAATPFAFGKLAEGGLAAKSGLREVGSLTGAAASLAKAPIKNALITQPTATLPVDMAQDVHTGNYKDLATNAGLIAGATVGAKVLPKLAGALKGAFVDTSGLFDHVKVADGQGGVTTVNQAVKNAEQAVASGEMSQSKYRTIVNNLKVSQDQNLGTHGTPYRAAKAITDYQEGQGRPTEMLTLDQFARDQGSLARAGRKSQGLAAKGNLFMGNGEAVKPELGNVTVGKASQSDKAQITKRLISGFSNEGVNSELAGARADYPQFFKNKNNAAKVSQIIQEATSPADLKARLNSEVTGTGDLFTKNAAGDLVPATHPGGYHSIIAQNPTVPFKTAREVPALDFGHAAPGGVVGRTLEKLGISPSPSEPGLQSDMVKQNFNDRIDQHEELKGQGDRIMRELRTVSGYSRGMSDLRLLPKKGIGGNVGIEKALQNLGIDTSEAGAVRKAIDGAYRDVPTSVQSLGGKAVSASIPVTRPILRAQEFARFIWNPFFRGVKVPAKTLFIGAMESPDGKILGKVDPEISAFVKGEGVQGVDGTIEGLGGDLPKISTGLVGKLQEGISSNLVRGLLEKAGVGPEALNTDPALRAEATKLVQVVYGYPKGTYLDSNLAKTLNVIIFPSRFETKILMATASYLGRMNPVARAGLIHGALNMANWAQTPAGQKWQKDNADLVGVANYFSPTQTIKEVLQVLHGDTHLPDYGEIGGLPFGFMYNILNGQGLTGGVLKSSNQKNPATGQYYADNIPQTDKARWYQALTDGISSMYSFPGQEVGLEKKSNLTAAALAIPGLKKPPAAEYKNVAPGSTSSAPTTPSLPRLTQPQINALTPTRPKVNFPTPPGPKAKAPKKAKKVKTPVPALSPFS